MNTVWLTGTTSGIGAQLALDLARRGWRLLLPARRPAALEPLARQALHVGAQGVEMFECDLSDHRAVAELAGEVAALGPLDLVINNAACGGGVDPAIRETNAAGVELRMATNAVTPHLVATRLHPALAAGGRIVQVGSMGQAALDLDDLGFTTGYDGVEAYMRSKLALVMSTIELGARGLPVNVVHPAHLMPTTMVRDSGFTPEATLDDGVLPVLRAALDSALANVRGRYFDRFSIAEPHPQAADGPVRSAVVAWIERTIASATEGYDRSDMSMTKRTLPGRLS